MTTSPPATPRGMVDTLTLSDVGPMGDDLAFARAYLADGPMDPEVLARLGDPERVAARERIKARRLAEDWAGLGRYREANQALAGRETEVVFIGDSITEMWRIAQPDLFTGGVVNRGYSGQTSPQILLRFMADVVNLEPRAVHLMCGINDIAGNTGPTTPDDYRNAVTAMLDLAEHNGICVALASLTPAAAFVWSPEIAAPGVRVAELNAWIAETAKMRGLTHIDYHAALAAPDGALRAELTRDGVHPTAAGYAVMRPLTDAALRAVTGER